jgi:ABC-type transporter lipoprotein component MlaA
MTEPNCQYDFEPLSEDEVIQIKTIKIKKQMKGLEGTNVFYKMNSDDEVTYNSENKYDTLRKTLYKQCNKFNNKTQFKTC